jgi:rfaE bifunctional protein kinase chain/domain/rfaE bifunctional protein nucleotidyltransferase chain/domain
MGKDKILLFEDLLKKVSELKEKGKTIVQSHGIFDLIHPGIINHLKLAKKEGDILIVTVIKDKDVRRGPGRPVFNENMRAENVASLEMVDYVSVVDDEVPFECIKRIRPHVFAKGQAYKERDKKIHDKIFEEEKEFYFGKTKIYETGGFTFSSSGLINSFLDILPEETKDFLKRFASKYPFDDIVKKINSLKDLKVLIIGDGIIDEYHYCGSMGKAGKAPLVVHKYIAHETFVGGAFAIANHIAGICSRVKLVTLLGGMDTKEDFIVKNFKPNIDAKFFYREDSPTILKKRYLNQYLNQKLFEINYLNDEYINEECEKDIIDSITSQIPQHDLVIVSDFGHGFITPNIIRAIQGVSRKIAVNTQTNSANAGFNMITKYSAPSYVCLDESEARWATQERFTDIEEVIKKLARTLKADHIIITLGKKGSVGIDKKGDISRTPIFSTKVIDTVGAGDAFFSFTAPCFVKGMPLDFVSFIGNAVGAIAVQIICNKRSVEKAELLEFINTILKYSQGG